MKALEKFYNTNKERHEGIVLRSLMPKKSKIIVLDCCLGKIECIVPNRTIAQGALIEYRPQLFRLTYSIETVQLIDMPFNLARTHIVFLHHVLELVYYFVPLDSQVSGIFDLLLFLYRIENKMCTSMFQIIFVCKFFALLGMFPECTKILYMYAYDFKTLSIEHLLEQRMLIDVQVQLKQWIYSCIAEHPRARYFKTIQWLKVGEKT